jgi:hypothetical protein
VPEFLPSNTTEVLQLGRWLVVPVVLAIILYRARRTVRPGRLGWEAMLVVGACLAYFLVRGLTVASEEKALANAQSLIDVQKQLGIFWEPRLQGLIVDYHVLVTLANWAYIWGHWPLIALVAIWLYLNHNDRYRLFRNAFMISGAIGLVIFATFPVAPPRLTDMDVVDTVSQYSTAYRVLQPPALVNQYAAVPSLHFGWNLLIGIALIMTARRLPMRIFGALMPVSMGLAIMLTANHYILDAVAGGAVALAGLLVAYSIRHVRVEDMPVVARVRERSGDRRLQRLER